MKVSPNLLEALVEGYENHGYMLRITSRTHMALLKRGLIVKSTSKEGKWALSIDAVNLVYDIIK